MKDWKFLFQRFILRQHKYESEVRRRLKKIKGIVFVDIGANIGLYSLLLKKNFAEVHAFEPNPKVYSVLKARVSEQQSTNVMLHKVALTDHAGSLPLFYDVETGRVKGKAWIGGGSIMKDWTYRPGHTIDGSKDTPHTWTEKVDVPCARLDDYLPKYLRWTRYGKDWSLNLVKIDVEGAEFQVLEGMRLSLGQKRIRNMMIELHDRLRTRELSYLLRDYGFELEWVDDDHVMASL